MGSEVTRPFALELRNVYFPVLDHGFVALKDVMGSDESIEAAARVSYAPDSTRKVTETRGLIRYLMRNRHCYRSDMQVLTAEGWKRWDECSEQEHFLVPNPATKELQVETLDVKSWEVDEELVTFESQRMSFAVTSDHRMWFKRKHSEEFGIERASECSRWGHFEVGNEYSRASYDGVRDALMEFYGFFLGDGSYASTNRVTFHLKKERKKEYLRGLLRDNGFDYSVKGSTTHDDAEVFHVDTSVVPTLDLDMRAEDKEFPLHQLTFFSDEQLRGLFWGLVNSDGHESDSRPQINFSSKSRGLIDLFEALAAQLGLDAHGGRAYHGVYQTTAHYPSRTSLESRGEYWGSCKYTGPVFCATSSTGLLLVRGGPDKFSFVCGNTSPFEQGILQFHIGMPLFVAQQWIRHRTASLNQESLRYSEATSAMFSPSGWRTQSQTNKQGSGTSFVHPQELHMFNPEHTLGLARDTYEHLLHKGAARELARTVLPVAQYTQMYWTMDLHNLFHFLSLRCDPHAQKEIRVYAEIIAGIVAELFPLSFEAWKDYVFESTTFTRAELSLLWDQDLFTLEEDGSFYRHGESDCSSKQDRQDRCLKLLRDMSARERKDLHHKLYGMDTFKSFTLPTNPISPQEAMVRYMAQED